MSQIPRLWIIVVTALLFIIVISTIILTRQTNSLLFNQTPTLQPTLNVESTPSPSIVTNSPSLQSPPSTKIPGDWRTFTSQSHGFTIQYPTDVKVEQVTGSGEVRILKLGPTQTEGTELFDGISVTIDSGSLNGQTLRQFVENRQQETRSEPVTQSVSPVQPIIVAGYSGYQYSSTGLGDSRFIYLPKGSNQFIRIINATVDPGNGGYAQVVNTMLSTLKVNP